MASKIIVRQGTAAQLATTILDVGEIGYVTDLRAAVIGDGSSTPPEFMSTKSTGSWDFSSTQNVNFNSISANTYSGVNVAQLNATPGILVKTVSSGFAARTLISGDGSIIFLSNANGAVGNPDIRVNPSLNLSSSTDGLILPVGTTSNRGTGVTGKIRYANNGANDPYKAVEVYSSDGSGWHALKEFITTNYITTIGTDYPTIELCLARHGFIDCTGYNQINFPEGVYNAPAQINIATYGIGKNWYFKGIDPIPKNIIGINSVSGSANNWSTVVAVDDITNVNVGNYLMIDGLQAYSPASIRGYYNCTGTAMTANNTIFTIEGTYGSYDYSTNFVYDLKVNDAVTINAQVGAVTAWTAGNQANMRFMTQVLNIANKTAATLLASIPYNVVGGVLYRHMFATGTVYVTGTTAYGIGTHFTTEYNLYDTIMVNQESHIIVAIVSDTQLTLEVAPINWPKVSGSAAQHYCNNNPELHLGTWKITAVDTINKLITVTNTCTNKPPVNKMGTGTCKILKSVINFSNPANDGFILDAGCHTTFQNIVILSGTGTGRYGIYIQGASTAVLGDMAFMGFTQQYCVVASKESAIIMPDYSKSCHFQACSVGIGAGANSTLVYNAQIVINNATSEGIYLSHSNIGSNWNSSLVWRNPLSITECGYGMVISNNSIANFYSFVIAFCNVRAISISNYSGLNLSMGAVIHDNANAVLNINGCYANLTNARIYGHLYNVNYTVNVIENRGQSVIVADYLHASNNNCVVLGGEGSTVTSQNVYCAASYQAHSQIQTSASWVANTSIFIGSNNGGATGNAHVCTDGGYHGFTGSYMNVPSGQTVGLCQNGSFSNFSSVTLVGSTTFSPAKLTNGNSNSYILN